MKKQEIDKYVDRLLSGEELVLSSANMAAFKAMDKKDLIFLHHSLGREIRNVFQLWKVKHKPKMVNGVDESPDHPDQISMRIIEGAWKRLQD